MKILLVEDDVSLCENIESILKTEGYEVLCTHDGDEGLYYIENNSCDLVILDWMLPELDGLSLLQSMRRRRIPTPVLMLSALGQVENRINGLDAGADDYLTKPFEMGELLARVRALVRRPAVIEASDTLLYADLTLESHSRKLTGPKACVHLSGREAAMLALFMRSSGDVLTKHTLFGRVWGPDSDTNESNIATYIHFLRRRLVAVGSCLQFRNHRGVGFSLPKPQR